MAIRTLTWRGFRAVSPQIALPRETQAAATVVQQLDQAADKLAKTQTPEQVRDILSEGFAQAMLSLALKRDPHVSMWGRAQYVLDPNDPTTLQPAQLFGAVCAAGPAGSGVAGVANNLLSPRKPLKPFLAHNVELSVVMLGTRAQLATLLGVSHISLQRGKESIFELPLLSALSGVVWVDHVTLAEVYQPPVIDVELSAAGGIELEGHGAPYALSDEIGLELVCDAPVPPGGVSDTGNVVMICARIDGETIE
jgi:hypothetical protein